jgi:hypothetical protein
MDYLLHYLLRPLHLVVFAVLAFLLFGSIGILERRRDR